MFQVQKESDRYHHNYYGNHELFEPGTWLEKPNNRLLEISKALISRTGVNILDLGAGVGRNAIPIAKYLGKSIKSVECVEIVPVALQKLKENALKYGVSETIVPVLADVSEYLIAQNKFDLIAAMSVLENAVDLVNFPNIIKKIQIGTKIGGYNCFSIATELTEQDSSTQEQLPPLIRSKFSAQSCEELLRSLYRTWEIQGLGFSPFSQCLTRDEKIVEWSAQYCLFVAVRKV